MLKLWFHVKTRGDLLLLRFAPVIYEQKVVADYILARGAF